MRVIQGNYQGLEFKFAIIVARFNEMITQKLLEGALDGLKRHGVEIDDTDVVWVPGSFEIPLVAKKLAQSGRYDAIITLGAVIRGSTLHFDLVAGQTASGITSASLDTGIPIIFEVLATDTIEQAIERSGTKMGNKGFEAAQAAIEMADVLQQVNTLTHQPVEQLN